MGMIMDRLQMAKTKQNDKNVLALLATSEVTVEQLRGLTVEQLTWLTGEQLRWLTVEQLMEALRID